MKASSIEPSKLNILGLVIKQKLKDKAVVMTSVFLKSQELM